jgi:hypothetical protein
MVDLVDVASGIGGFVLDGEGAYDFSGMAVAGAGDVDGDGLADVIVGAAGAGANGLDDVGRTYVVFGKTDTDAVPLGDLAQEGGGFVLAGEAAGDYSGKSVSAAGDVDGDGLADVMVGAPEADAGGVEDSGRAYVVFGKAAQDQISLADVSQGTGGFVLDGAQSGDFAGSSVSFAGDVDGDQLGDVIVAAPRADPNGPYSGRTYVVLGKTDTAPVSLADLSQGTGGFVLDGEAEGDYSGGAVRGAGDVNGDGLFDVIVGAPDADPHGRAGAGRAYVVFGKTDTQAVSLADVSLGIGGFVLDGEAEWDHAGSSVSSAGDVDGDGLSDLVVGVPWADPDGRESAGRTCVVFGKADTDPVALSDVALGIGGFVLSGESESDYSGSSIAGAGDVNGDGRPDLIVSAPAASPDGRTGAGRTYVVFGDPQAEEISLADVAQGIGGFVLDGEAEHTQSGSSLDGAGDVSGDGLADLVLGSWWTPNGPGPGRTYVVFGQDLSCPDG